MTRMSAWAALVFCLTLLLNLPAAFIVRSISWPSGWQPDAVSGTLWEGQMARLGVLGPLAWTVRPWSQQVLLNVAFQQRSWDLSLHGWPWDWQARLLPGEVRSTPPGTFLLTGQWAGELTMRGAGRACLAGDGELSATHLAVLSPWMMNLGAADIRLTCQQGLKLMADVQLQGEHDFDVQVDVARQRVQINGQVQPGAAFTPLLVQSRWLQPGESAFSKVLGAR